jgi:hypothetical protein
MKAFLFPVLVALSLGTGSAAAQSRSKGPNLPMPTGFIQLTGMAEAGDSWVESGGNRYFFATNARSACPVLSEVQKRLLFLSLERGWPVNLFMLSVGNNLTCITGVVVKTK